VSPTNDYVTATFRVSQSVGLYIWFYSRRIDTTWGLRPAGRKVSHSICSIARARHEVFMSCDNAVKVSSVLYGLHGTGCFKELFKITIICYYNIQSDQNFF
jgi:hypothetical protein